MTTQDTAKVREQVSQIITNAKGVRVNNGKNWSGFTYITDAKDDVDAIMLIVEEVERSATDRYLEGLEYGANEAHKLLLGMLNDLPPVGTKIVNKIKSALQDPQKGKP